MKYTLNYFDGEELKEKEYNDFYDLHLFILDNFIELYTRKFALCCVNSVKRMMNEYREILYFDVWKDKIGKLNSIDPFLFDIEIHSFSNDELNNEKLKKNYLADIKQLKKEVE